MSTAIQVEHRPYAEQRLQWVASMYENGTFVSGTVAVKGSRDSAIAACRQKYEALRVDVTQEWVPYDGEDAA